MAFRRTNLPDDPDRFSNLEELGYFIDENDKIARIDDPSKGYHIKANKNPRYSQTRHEDFEEACRRVIEKRLLTEDIAVGYIPRALDDEQVFPLTLSGDQAPIFFSEAISLPGKYQRLVLLVGTSNHDPHVISHNILDNHGVNAGSVVNFVKEAHTRDRLGVIIANTGQRLWSKTLRKAVTYSSYDALPRDKATDPSPLLDQENPYVFGNGDAVDHLSVLFRDLVIPTIKANHDSPKLYIICIDDAVHGILKLMQSNWSEYSKFTAAIVACNGTVDKSVDMHDTEFIKFWSERCKHYWTDSLSIDTPIEVVPGIPNYFSSGVLEKRPNAFHYVYKRILEYFDQLHDDPLYKLPPFVPIQTFNDLDDKVEDGGEGEEGWASDDGKESRKDDGGLGPSYAGNRMVADGSEGKE